MTRGGTEDGAVVVTGATGFLGRAVLHALDAVGIPSVALVRPTTDRTRLPRVDRLEVVEYRTLGDSDVADALREHAPTAFIHSGWAGVAGPERGSTDHVAINVPTTIASVKLAAAVGCASWVGVGSQAEYGPSEDVLVEASPLRPVTGYGLAKVAAAAAAHAVGESLGIATSWARVFSLYGPGDHAGAILPFAARRMLEGESPELGACTHDWDLLHVDDAAAALLALARARATGAFNLASGERRPLRNAIELAADAAGGPRPAYGARGDAAGTPLRASAERLREVTGWTPRIPLEVGVPRMVEHLRKSRDTVLTGATK